MKDPLKESDEHGFPNCVVESLAAMAWSRGIIKPLRLVHNRKTGDMALVAASSVPSYTNFRDVCTIQPEEFHNPITLTRWQEINAMIADVQSPPCHAGGSSPATMACQSCSFMLQDAELVAAHCSTGAGECSRTRTRCRSGDCCGSYYTGRFSAIIEKPR